MSSLKLHYNTLAFKSDLLRLKYPLENYLSPLRGDLINNSQQIRKANDVVEDYEGLSCNYEQHGLLLLHRDYFSFSGPSSDKISLHKKIKAGLYILINPYSG